MRLSKNALGPEMHRSKNTMHPKGETSDQDAFFKYDVFLHKNVVGIKQSIQNQALRIGSENDKNDLIQNDET